MPGLVPGIHVLETQINQRRAPGHFVPGAWMAGHPRDEVPAGGHDESAYPSRAMWRRRIRRTTHQITSTVTGTSPAMMNDGSTGSPASCAAFTT
jgi:hypothetical protein